MIQGKAVTLRTARLEERRRVYEMGLSTGYMENCFAQVFEKGLEDFEAAYSEEYFDGRAAGVRGGMMVCLGEEPIGFASYGQINNFVDRDWVYHFGTMELDIWMDGEKHCGRGYGVDAIVTLTDYLHDTYGIRTFMICPERANPRAIRSYAKAGFKEVEPDEKPKVLRGIFGPRGLEMLTPEDEYWNEESCFMIKKYDAE